METPASDHTEPAQRLRTWWDEINADPKPGQPNRRGERAELRRCDSVEEVLFTPAFHRAFRRLQGTPWGNDPVPAAAVIGLLSHVERQPEDSDGSIPRFATHLATARQGGDTPRVSEARFQRLMACETLTELYPALIRVIRLIGKSAPVVDLAKGVHDWNADVRRQWTLRYYEKALAQQGQ